MFTNNSDSYENIPTTDLTPTRLPPTDISENTSLSLSNQYQQQEPYQKLQAKQSWSQVAEQHSPPGRRSSKEPPYGHISKNDMDLRDRERARAMSEQFARQKLYVYCFNHG